LIESIFTIALFWRPELSFSRGWRMAPTTASPFAQVVPLTWLRDVDAIVAREVAARSHEGVAVEHVEDAGDRMSTSSSVILASKSSFRRRHDACDHGSGCGPPRSPSLQKLLLIAVGVTAATAVVPLLAAGDVLLAIRLRVLLRRPCPAGRVLRIPVRAVP
jgi:hypothetical protein